MAKIRLDILYKDFLRAAQLRESFVKRFVMRFLSDNYRIVRRMKGNWWVQYDMGHYGGYCASIWEQVTCDEWHELKYDRQHGKPNALRCIRFEQYETA